MMLDLLKHFRLFEHEQITQFYWFWPIAIDYGKILVLTRKSRVSLKDNSQNLTWINILS